MIKIQTILLIRLVRETMVLSMFCDYFKTAENLLYMVDVHIDFVTIGSLDRFKRA